MTREFLKTAGLLLLAGTVVLTGCKGDDGKDGVPCNVSKVGDVATITCDDGTVVVTDGTDGTNGTNGTNGVNGTNGTNGVNGTNGTNGVNGTDGVNGVNGTDGVNGTNGVNGVNGTNGQSCLMTTNVEGTRTVTCPDGSTWVLPPAVTGTVAVSAVDLTASTATDVVLKFNVTVSGASSSAFMVKGNAYRHAFDSTIAVPGYVRTAIPTYTVAVDTAGLYTVTFAGLATTIGTTPTTLMVTLNPGSTTTLATVIAYVNGGSKVPAVSDDACKNCHGNNVFFTGTHHGANPQGVGACIVCHVLGTSSEDRLGTADTATVAGTAPSSRLMGYVHGIHNSHNMPGATKLDGTTVVPGGIYYRRGRSTSQFSIGFPGYMDNCSTCHDSPASIAAVKDSTVSWKTCMSCHVGPPTIVTSGGTVAEVAPGFAWAGFGVPATGPATAPIFLFGGVQNHGTYTVATNCSTANCHDGITAPATIAAFHNGLVTERAGLIWDGADQSVIQGARVAMQLTSVSKAGTNLVVTWTATQDGVAVDPCNLPANVANGPVFLGATATTAPATGMVASNMSILKAYAQGNDWVNAGQAGTVAPGQPTNVNLSTTNTVCASNVATSTVAADAYAVAGTTGTVALQGKPQVRFAGAAGTAHEVIQVRSKSPTLEFVVPAADGPAVAPTVQRRPIVSVDKCNACHLGTLYQHGGNRVDSTDLCVMCHNPASNEKNNRAGFFGVDASEAYDGKAGETYDLRTMVHSIHSAGESGRSYVVYRTRGIYFFGNAASLADAIANKHWPTTGGVTCNTAEGPATYYEVYGSVPGATEMVPVVKADGSCDLTGGATPVPATHAWQIHNVVLVEYPRPLNQCSACHVSGSDQVFPDPTKAVAVTVDAGGTTYGDQLDDVLIGSSAQSCMTCHQSGDAVTQAQIRGHAYQNGWVPQVFANGRQDILNLVQIETCSTCHGAGKSADFNAAHSK